MQREEKLARILIAEAEENEPLWTDYEYEEAQTKLDLADIILDCLCLETVKILNDVQQKREIETNTATTNETHPSAEKQV